MKESNLTNLVVDAVRYGDAQASSRRWLAHYRDGVTEVWHRGTHMIDVARDGAVTAVNRGYGSTSDRCGIRRITAGYNGHEGSVGYRELFEEAS
jgi:hypothetical protein